MSGFSFKEQMDKIAEAQRVEREAKRSVMFQLAEELGYSVFPRGEAAGADVSANEPHHPASPPPAKDHVAAFDGTFKGLIDVYRAHEKSGYQRLKHKVRGSYDQMLNRIDKDAGTERVAEWSAERVQNIYDTNWAAGGKIAMGHSLVGKLRTLTGFGSVVLNDEACTRLSTILGNMRFPVAEKRTGILTHEHARAVRAMAHSKFSWPSIALAQALQFEIPKLRQLDIIGEWVPISEPGTPDSDVTRGDEKWVSGLRWSEIDDNMILRHVILSGRKNQPVQLEIDLRRFSMIMEEINRVPPWSRNGPVVVSEFSGMPWTASEFRRKWRLVADAAGVPSEIKITDGARGNSPTAEQKLADGGSF